MIVAPAEIKPVTAAARAGQALSAVLAGKVIEARLSLALADGLFRFSSPEGEIDLPLPRALPPGTEVRISARPDGSLQVTVLTEDGLPALPPSLARALPNGAPPPATTTVMPRSPLPQLPPGQEMPARVIANPEPGIVRIAIGASEVDLPLPKP